MITRIGLTKHQLLLGTLCIITLLLFGCTRSADEALLVAAKDGDAARITSLIQHGANPNGLAGDGWTALTVAAREGHFQCVEKLVQMGSDVNVPEGGGNTALYWASFYGHVDVIKFLLSKGADVNKASKG